MQASFSLWQADSSISLFSAGGNITPTTMAGGNGGVRDGRYWYPPIISVTASSGSIYWDGGRCGDLGCDSGIPPIELSPSPLGQVERSEERRVGKECVSTGRFRGSRYSSK